MNLLTQAIENIAESIKKSDFLYESVRTKSAEDLLHKGSKKIEKVPGKVYRFSSAVSKNSQSQG